MPTQKQWQDAVNWALQNDYYYEYWDIYVEVTKDTHMELVSNVRVYLNENNIDYSTFSYRDLEPYL